jgi:protein gp37
VRFISAEPLLGPVDIASWVKFARFEEQYRELAANCGGEDKLPAQLRWNGKKPPALDWVIIGVEKLAGGRPGRNRDAYESHARSLLRHCAAAGVAAFHKQTPVNGRVSGDPSEWLEDLRVREFPSVRA